MCLRLILASLLVLTPIASGQQPGGFVIDQSRPYVYIKFDHIGNRKPLGRDEPTQGLWLRLVNNCRVPISVRTFDPGTGDPGVGLLDEVVPVSGGPPSTASPLRGKVPEGYSSEVASSMIVLPGENLLFSVPSNHVSRDWYLRIQFQLVQSKKAVGLQPYSYAEFSRGWIPEKDRGHLRP